MAKAKVTIIHVEPLDGTSKKTGAEYHMRLAQCIVTTANAGPDGKPVEKRMVGELVLPESLKDTRPGDYVAEFELAISRDKRVGAQLVALTPLGQPAVAR